MEKPAATEHPIHELFERRWSPRAFSARAVEPEKLRSLLEAARWAASCFNEQPWSFIVAAKEDEGDAYERLLSCLAEANALWAGRAPVLMLSVARLTFKRNDKPNRHAFHDVGQAAAHLALQATASGLAVHQMAGFDLSKARELFSIPEGFEPVAAIALGYPGEPEDLPEDLRARESAPRTRLPFGEFVFGESWGRPRF
jgi:nitroreductase